MRAWVLKNQTREFIFWSALVAPLGVFSTMVVTLLLVFLGDSATPEILFYLLWGPILLISNVVWDLLASAPARRLAESLGDIASLLLYAGFVIPLVTFLWMSLLPVATVTALRVGDRLRMWRGPAASASDGPPSSHRNAIPIFAICAFVNALAVGYAAGILQPVVLRPRTDIFDWRFAMAWFIGIGLPYAFSPLLLMFTRRLFLPPNRNRAIEFWRWYFADSWREYVVWSALVALLPSAAFVLAGQVPMAPNYIVPPSVLTFLASPLQMFWTAVGRDIDLDQWFRVFGQFNEELENLALLGLIGPALTLAWLILVPTGLRAGISIWRWITGQLQTRQLARDRLFGFGVPSWLVAAALMNSFLLGVAALRALPSRVSCETYFCIDMWPEFAPLMLLYGAPYAFAPLILMAARRFFLRLREE